MRSSYTFDGRVSLFFDAIMPGNVKPRKSRKPRRPSMRVPVHSGREGARQIRPIPLPNVPSVIGAPLYERSRVVSFGGM